MEFVITSKLLISKKNHAVLKAHYYVANTYMLYGGKHCISTQKSVYRKQSDRLMLQKTNRKLNTVRGKLDSPVWLLPSLRSRFMAAGPLSY